MSSPVNEDRRRIIGAVVMTGAGVITGGCSNRADIPTKENKSRSAQKKEDEVSPAEDLMREHGVLKRVLLVYRESVRRIDARQELPPEVLTGSANLIRRFIEDYHEKLEEQFVFPRFRKANRLVQLVDVLETQHQKGRVLTETVLRLATSAGLKAEGSRGEIKQALQAFVRMYEPHEAREDTVLFPEFRKIVSPKEYDALGEDFEKKEHELFGEDGFDKNVEQISKFEKALGIYDLAQFTPAV